MKGKVVEKVVLKESPLSRVHLHINMKRKVSEKVVLKGGCLQSGIHRFHGNMKGEVSEKVVLKEEWSLTRGSFPWKHEGRDFRKGGLK